MDSKGSAGLIGLMIFVGIIVLMAYFVFPKYLGGAQKAGSDPVSATGALESARTAIKGVEAIKAGQAQ